ncbi:MAG: glucosidase, partial [Candidatus Omnitrophica bacterium]|nr:glucosidase [Candidatus Omnitrophota bacterium]
RERLTRVLRYLLDEREFLSPYGLRSLSRIHQERPYVLAINGQEHRVEYEPGESASGLFGGNSNWRGPVWFPLNYLLIEALERYHHFYGETLQVECPTGSGRMMTLQAVAQELAKRLAGLFLPDEHHHRPCHGGAPRFAQDPLWKELVLFHEYFHGEDGRGLGASHQTGWSSLVVRCLEDLAKTRASRSATPISPRASAQGATRKQASRRTIISTVGRTS